MHLRPPAEKDVLGGAQCRRAMCRESAMVSVDWCLDRRSPGGARRSRQHEKRHRAIEEALSAARAVDMVHKLGFSHEIRIAVPA